MVITFSFGELVNLIKKRFFLILVIMILCTCSGFTYSKIIFNEEYRAVVSFSIKNANDDQVINEINQIRYNLLERESWLSTCLAKLGEEVTSKNIDVIQRALLIERVPETNQANLLLQLPSSKKARQLAQIIAQIIQEQNSNLHVLDSVKMIRIPSAWKRITALSAFFGALLGYFLVVVLEIYRMRFDLAKMAELFQQNKIKVKKVSPTYFLLKRCVDLIFGSIGLIFFIVVYSLLIIPYSIGENKGPILFKQLRYGIDGELFSIYKFRSMKANAENILKSNSALYQKYLDNDYKLLIEEDPRITKIGCFLRKTSVDELPQFINVIKGEMSLVGPRPIITEEINQYGDKAPIFFSMKPGITGVWGANGRSKVNYPERKAMELSYLAKRSLKFDFELLFKTFFKVLAKDGAY